MLFSNKHKPKEIMPNPSTATLISTAKSVEMSEAIEIDTIETIPILTDDHNFVVHCSDGPPNVDHLAAQHGMAKTLDEVRRGKRNTKVTAVIEPSVYW